LRKPTVVLVPFSHPARLWAHSSATGSTRACARASAAVRPRRRARAGRGRRTVSIAGR
jgi:hypothetical protein